MLLHWQVSHEEKMGSHFRRSPKRQLANYELERVAKRELHFTGRAS